MTKKEAGTEGKLNPFVALMEEVEVRPETMREYEETLDSFPPEILNDD